MAFCKPSFRSDYPSPKAHVLTRRRHSLSPYHLYVLPPSIPQDLPWIPRADLKPCTDGGWVFTVGISSRINQDDGQTPRICPRCNNGTPELPVHPPHRHKSRCAAEREYKTKPVSRPLPPRPLDTKRTDACVYFPVAVVSAKKKTYFELFCVPIFPMSSKHVWVCGICQWRVPLQQGYVLTSLSMTLSII